MLGELILGLTFEPGLALTALNKYPNMVKLGQNPGYSTRPSVVI